MRKAILIAILFAASACGLMQSDPGLPDGYELLCSIDGKYTVSFPSDGFLPRRTSANVFDSEIAAKEYAWFWETNKNVPLVKPSAKYTWTVCKEAK